MAIGDFGAGGQRSLFFFLSFLVFGFALFSLVFMPSVTFFDVFCFALCLFAKLSRLLHLTFIFVECCFRIFVGVNPLLPAASRWPLQQVAQRDGLGAGLCL